MSERAPGHILQQMHLKNRINQWVRAGMTFIEVGAGNGSNSEIFLKMNLTGIGYDLNENACESNMLRNQKHIDSGSYKVILGDFFNHDEEQKADIILSCMVIEHLPEDVVARYFEKCNRILNPGGRIISFVPSSMKHWGVEDDIAGHFKRYSFECFDKIARDHELQINNLAGLTYPLSNWLLPISNKIVNKAEGYKKEMTMDEQTVASGKREVKFKTVYPWYVGVVLNELTMYPFYLMQRIFSKNPNSLVIYSELQTATE